MYEGGRDDNTDTKVSCKQQEVMGEVALSSGCPNGECGEEGRADEDGKYRGDAQSRTIAGSIVVVACYEADDVSDRAIVGEVGSLWVEHVRRKMCLGKDAGQNAGCGSCEAIARRKLTINR